MGDTRTLIIKCGVGHFLEVRRWKDGVGGIFLTRTSSGLVKPDFSEGKELGLGGGLDKMESKSPRTGRVGSSQGLVFNGERREGRG